MPKKAVKATRPAQKPDPMAIRMIELNDRAIGTAEARIEELRKMLRRGLISQEQMLDGVTRVIANTKNLPGASASIIKMKADSAFDDADMIESRGAKAREAAAVRATRSRVVKLTPEQKAANVAAGFAAASENVARPLRLMSAPTLFGGEMSAAEMPAVKLALEQAASARTPAQFKMASEGAQHAATRGVAGQRLRTRLGQGLIGGLGAALLGKMLFGGGEEKKAPIDPQVQMALMQQLSGAGQGDGGVNTSRTLVDAGRLLTLLTKLQGLASLSGPTPSRGFM